MKSSLFFSIIIPAKSHTALSEITPCLSSLKNQTYKYFDVTIVTDQQTAKKFKPLTKKYPFLSLSIGNYSKAQARNKGASQTNGMYLIHLDVDYILDPQTLEQCHVAITKQNAKAVVIHETIVGNTLWQKARKLERQINLEDDPLSAPQCLERKLFEEIKGFDEQAGDLDDWGLYLKLQSKKRKTIHLPPLAQVHEPTNFLKIFRHRYRKGQYLPILKQKYGNILQIRPADRLYWYKKNWKLLFHDPQVTTCLFLLKIFDYIPFFLGTFNPIATQNFTNPYAEQHVATGFDLEQQSVAAKYKNYSEITALIKLLGKPTGKILELGAGTGRITQQLTNKNYKVTPSDISAAMLTELKTKHLPKPILITDSSKLPCKDNQFDSVISMRVIWHIMYENKREEFFAEAARVCSGSIILDLSNKQKYQSPFVQFVIRRISPSFFSNTHYFSWQEIEDLALKNNLHIQNRIPLEVLAPAILIFFPSEKFFPFISQLEHLFVPIIPPGRYLIKFTKIK
jgi:ubiquinone/menaquinone biosynthesis C-methylase UbiE/glycosyltransferase involved in cell wall biosynthesis